MRFFIFALILVSKTGLCKVTTNNGGKFVVSGLYGAVVCKNQEIILKRRLPVPCEIVTGKNSFLELTGDSKEKVIVGASSSVIVDTKFLQMKKGSMRIEGDRVMKVSAHSHNVIRTTGKQLFFSSEVFSDLELLSLKGDINFEEKILEGEKEKKIMTLIPENSWASIGGRFGNELGDFYEVSEKQANYFSGFLLPQSSE